MRFSVGRRLGLSQYGDGALGAIRTRDPRIRNPVLYPPELRGHEPSHQLTSFASAPSTGGLAAPFSCSVVALRRSKVEHSIP